VLGSAAATAGLCFINAAAFCTTWLCKVLMKPHAVLCRAVVCLQVNADEHRSLGERFGVTGFPTIKYFARGKPVTSDGAQA
jgi:thioredoxin-like negative regulator of GroEL